MPPEETAAPATATTEPTAPTEAVAGSRADVRSARPTESVAEQMERLGWDKEKPHTENPEALGSKARAASAEGGTEEPDDEPTKPEVPNPKPPKQPKPDPKLEANEEKRAQLAALVTELGMQLEDGRVMPAERVALRAERREAQQKIEKLEREAMERIEKSAKALEEKTPQLKKLEDFEAAINSGDHEAVAKFMGFESYDKWQEHIIALKSDPSYQKVRALEQKAAEAEKREREREEARVKEEAERKAAAEKQQREQAEAAERESYLRGVAQTMAKSSDPLLKVMHDDPGFVNAIFRVQKDHWDGESAPMSLEQAIRTPAKGVQMPLMAEMKRLYEKLAPIFGSPQSNPSTVVAAVKAGIGKQPIAPAPEKKAPRTPQPNKASAITAARETEQERKRRWASQMEAAAREDLARMKRSNGAARG